MFKTGPLFVFLRIQSLARVLGSLPGIVYSRHKCTIPLAPSASSVMKYCPLTTVFKPTLEHSLENFWSSDSSSNCCSLSSNRFHRRCSSVRGSAVGVSVSISMSPDDNVLLVSHKPWCLWMPPWTYLPPLCSVDTELICRNDCARSIRRFVHYR